MIIKYNKLKIPTAGDFFACASSQYVSLLLVKVDKKGKKEYNISGEINEVLRPVPCSEDDPEEIQPRLHDVLDVRDEQVKVILIEGGPGMGKSTLAVRMCQCWGTGGVLTSYDLVILLTLRDPQIQASKSLYDILCTTDADKTLVENMLQIIEDSQGKNVCFLLEGYDELPTKLRKNQDCIFNALSTVLPKCTIIYTSRPNACEKLCSMVSRRIKILGFEECHIYQYVENAFKNYPDGANMSSDLKLKLKCNPILKDLTKTPINTAIACNIFCVKSDLPDTLTEFYEILCLQVILWHIKNRTDNEDGINALCDLNYLPYDLPDLFAQVCFIAYQGTVDDILIFSTKYLQRLNIFKGNINGLSLLMNAPMTSVYGQQRSYNFLHRTVQDFCAAWYIFKLSATDQCDCFNKYRFSSSFQYVWRFFSGLSKFENEELFRSMLPFRYINTQLKNIATFELLHFIYEAREENCDWNTVEQHIQNTIDLSYHKLDQVSCHALGYFLENYEGDIKKIDLSYCEITSECVEILSLALNRRLKENTKPIIYLYIDISSVQDSSSKSIATLLKSHYPLYSLTASNSNLSDSIRPALSMLQSNVTLHELVLRDTSLDLLSIRFLTNALMINKTLKILNIGNNNIGDRGAKFFSHCRNVCITDLIMWNCSVGPDGAVSIGTMVAHNPSIKCLRLGNNQLGNSGTKNLMNILRQSDSLQILDLWGNNINHTGASYLKELITNDHSKICCLVLGANPLKDLGVACILQAVLNKQVVKQLDIRDTYITGSSSPIIEESLKVLETLKFTPPIESECIARALASKTISLGHMQLHNGTDEAYETLLKGLQTHCDSLHKLEFSRGDLRSRGIRYLANLVEHSRNLKEIVLRWMDIVPLDYLLFATAFKNNKSVEKLSITPLDSQDNDDDFTEEFLRRLKMNLTLKQLLLNVKVEHSRVYDNNAECTFIRRINQYIEEINSFRSSHNAAPLILHLAST